jgi:glucose-6-phosphate 1-dehydrogenase
VTEVRLFTRRVPSLAFMGKRERAERNQIVLRIDPDPGMRLQLVAAKNGTWRDVHLDSSFAADLGESIQPYERLLQAGLAGDRQLFAREDAIEQTWRIIQPLLDTPGEVHPYEPGSWGPDAAHALLRGHQDWRPPWMPSSSHA